MGSPHFRLWTSRMAGMAALDPGVDLGVDLGVDSGVDSRLQANIGEDESVALDDLAAFDGDWAMEHGAVEDAGVKLAVLAAGVDAWGKFGEEILVEVAAGEFAREFFGVDADDAGFDSGCDHLVEEGSGVAAPDGKDGCK